MRKIPFGKFGFIHTDGFEWIRNHTTSLAAALTAVLAVASWMIYQARFGSYKDHLAIEKIFNEWKGNRNEELVKLQKILKAHPELHATYDGRIAQKLILNSEHGLAHSFNQATLKRIGSLSHYYIQFSEGSMLMTQKKYTEALAQAKELKTKLDSDARFWDNRYQVVKHGDILYGYNLLRIAFLEQLCGNLEGELQAWNELKKHVGWAPSTGERKLDPQSCELLCQNFQKNSISLQDFIEHREHLLKAALDGSAASTQ